MESTPLLDTLLVKVRRWDGQHLDEVVARYGGTVALRMPDISWASVRIDHSRAADLFRAFESDPDVVDVDFDFVASTNAVVPYHSATNDALLDLQHGLKRMNVFGAWKHSMGAGVLVAIVDQGIGLTDRAHPMLSSKTMYHWNGLYDAATMTDEGGVEQDLTLDMIMATAGHLKHGLGCISSAIGGGINDGVGPVGVAPMADLLNMVNHDTMGHATISGTVNGCMLARSRFGAKIISCSYGTSSSPTLTVPTIVRDMLNYLTSAGALVLFSAGNGAEHPERGGAYQFPAAGAVALGHLGVGATSYTEPDVPAIYSNCGANANIVTEGSSNFTLYNYVFWFSSDAGLAHAPHNWTSDDGTCRTTDTGLYYDYRAFDGTSNATPLVAGVCALVLSLNPSWTGQQVRDIVLSTTDKGQHPLFYKRFSATTGVANALKAVLKAKSLINPGTIYPYVGLFGPGVTVDVVTGVATTHLRGAVKAEVTGLCTDAITSVELWAGTELLYSGPPRTTWDSLIEFSAAKFAGRQLRVVARTAGSSAEDTYSDIVGHDIGALAPQTKASLAPGQYAAGALITLSALSDNPPVRISYRWGIEAWQTYSSPIQIQPGTLQFYGVDAAGNIEGGIDHAAL